ncbi:MAG: hypothetical protein U0800_27385 [Isosphaeraceae bacterium]
MSVLPAHLPSRREFAALACSAAFLGFGGCGSDVPEAGTIDPRSEGVRPNRVRGKPAGSPVSTEPDPAGKRKPR